jgi:hypothetical protein
MGRGENQEIGKPGGFRVGGQRQVQLPGEILCRPLQMVGTGGHRHDLVGRQRDRPRWVTHVH